MADSWVIQDVSIFSKERACRVIYVASASMESEIILIAGLLWLCLGVAVVRAVMATRGTSFDHARWWMLAAWSVTSLALLPAATPTMQQASFALALCVVGAFAVAVLGARRPNQAMWNSVVAGFLAVELLPFARTLAFGGKLTDELLPWLFVLGTIAVGVANYLRTRFLFIAVFWLLSISYFAIRSVVSPESIFGPYFLCQMLSVAPIFFFPAPIRCGLSRFDRLWLKFRDTFGWFWAQRTRDQFQLAAKNKGLKVSLAWSGLTMENETDEAAALSLLRSLLKRFMAENDLRDEGEISKVMPKDIEMP